MSPDQKLVATLGLFLLMVVLLTTYRTYLLDILFTPPLAPKTGGGKGQNAASTGLPGPHYGRYGVPA